MQPLASTPAVSLRTTASDYRVVATALDTNRVWEFFNPINLQLIVAESRVVMTGVDAGIWPRGALYWAVQEFTEALDRWHACGGTDANRA